ncbi:MULTISPECIES: EAL and HDOD domain-containing protein [unclassified Neptuniibacter]|uniref:EAL and HDOD domain-containing protein n=1 Tax=unclassified Neptuniibacter TaxID=2630693 RepID=UPI0026E44AA9|nr:MULTISPECIES: HDOD domain-containing protein [unclassified Neptuniibacter]MDO6515171.1 HDOD domain-containing protein [Neptuniibacter sp. 2_MG-2023]MDO6592239.1 HDOD domain-containing protein [Neptuniibacter sp. 1_MG-2023]
MDQIENSQVLMARQPIFDRNQKVVAYELLYRTEDAQGHALFANSEATSEVILNAYTSISDSGELKRVPAFINLTRDILVEQRLPEVSKKYIVLEILEDIEPDKEVLSAVQKLHSEGYRIAMDDFVYSPKYDELLKLAHIVKIDVYELSMDQVREQVKELKKHKVTLLAEKIETHEELETCIELGFKLFQGHFLSRPKVVKGKKIQGSQVALMQLIQELQSPKATPEKLEELIMRDPALTYKLLRIVNSAGYSLVRQVESIAEAIVLLGLEQVKKWATLIAMSSNQDKPEELSRSLLIRGRMCEEVARAAKLSNYGSYFMAGMMSGLHAMLDIERETMLEQVPLGDDIKEAVSLGQGPIGAVLRNVVNYENGDWDLLPPDLDGNIYDKAYRASLEWTQESMQAMYE